MAKQEPICAPPPGFRWVYNRLGRVVEDMFDHVVYVFQPHEERLMPEEVATYLWVNSIISMDLATNRGKRSLVLDGDAVYKVPLEGSDEPTELIDRTSGDNPMGRGTGGLKTKATRVAVK